LGARDLKELKDLPNFYLSSRPRSFDFTKATEEKNTLRVIKDRHLDKPVKI
jgi:hypothetical protein